MEKDSVGPTFREREFVSAVRFVEPFFIDWSQCLVRYRLCPVLGRSV
jgi:hypothetical protein